jgi:hypothetical protein
MVKAPTQPAFLAHGILYTVRKEQDLEVSGTELYSGPVSNESGLVSGMDRFGTA